MKRVIDINNTLTISKIGNSISSDELDFDMYDDIFGFGICTEEDF